MSWFRADFGRKLLKRPLPHQSGRYKSHLRKVEEACSFNKYSTHKYEKKKKILNNEIFCCSDEMANSESPLVVESFLWVCPRLSLILSGAWVWCPGSAAY